MPENAKESSEDADKTCVRQAYQLLRQFCFSYNYLNNAEEADRFVIPADFESEIKEVLTDKYYSQFAAAIKASKDEYQKELPDSISSDVGDRLLKFVAVKEKDHVISKFESNITDLTEKVTAKVAERNAIQPAPPKREKSEKPKRAKRVRRNSGASDSNSSSLEDRLSDILKEVSKRSDSVRFSKDDFESFSEAQTQLDSLLRETVTEILSMKQSLRKRFARAQDGRGKRSNSNKGRREKKD